MDRGTGSGLRAACLVLAAMVTACDMPPSGVSSGGGGTGGGAGIAGGGAGDGGGTGGEMQGGADAGTVSPDAGIARPFTVIGLPDTQYYAAAYPQIFARQADWIAENKAALNIAFVVHEGDVVDSDVMEQWQIAADSLHRLDGVVPYFVTAGNHDYHNGCRDTMIDAYFPVSGFTSEPWFGGTFEPGRIENNFGIVPVGGGPSWLVLELEFGPRDEVLAWANSVLDQHADLPAMVVTHAYLYTDSTRYDAATRPDQYFSPLRYQLKGSVNDGEGMWRGLVSRHDNIKLVLSGHVIPTQPWIDPDATGRLTSTRSSGSRCHQILANYQTCGAPPCAETLGGGGFLRIMRFDPTAHQLAVSTYSPYLDQYKTDDANQFDLPLD